MAEVDVSVEAATPAGLTPTYKGSLSATDQYLYPNDGKAVLIVENGGSEDTVVTVETPGTEGGLAIADRTVTVPKEGGQRIIGPFKRDLYNNADGKMKVSFSKVTTVTVAAVRVG